MSKRIYLTNEIYLDIEVKPSQLLFIVIMFTLLFVMPIYAHSRINNNQNTYPETYTENSLEQGQVAGASTSRTDGVITLPILNSQFDPSLRDKASQTIAFGGAFAVVSIVFFVLLLKDAFSS